MPGEVAAFPQVLRFQNLGKSRTAPGRAPTIRRMTPPPTRAGIPLAAEQLLLTTRGMLGALDAGLAAEATRAGDPWTGIRIAFMEQIAGRGEAALARAAAIRATAGEADLVRACDALRRFQGIWSGQPEPRVPIGAEFDDEPGGLLLLVADAFHLVCGDAPRSPLSWQEIGEVLDRIERAADRWLAGTTGAAILGGLPAAVYALGVAVVSERSPWAASFGRALHRRTRAARLNAWLPAIDYFCASAALYLGRFDEYDRLLVRVKDALRAEPGQPWLPMALAGRYALAGLSRPADAGSPERIVDELVAGRWRGSYPFAKQIAFELLGRAVTARGDSAEGMAIIELGGEVERYGVPHVMRVYVLECAFEAAADAGDRAEAERWLAYTEGCYDSATRRAAAARMRLRLGDPVDPTAPATESGVATDPLRARVAMIAAAVERHDRDAALRELATLAVVATRLRANALRSRAAKLIEAGGRPSGRPLSDREFEIAALAGAGLTNRQIATELHLSPRTVETHVGRALDALGLQRRAQFAGVVLPHRDGDRPLDLALTRRQAQVGALVAAGCTNREIATTLGISPSAVEKHVTALLGAFGVSARAGIAAAMLDATR